MGGTASIRCSGRPPVEMVEWLDYYFTAVATTREQTLDLNFNPVKQSHDNSVYTCLVIDRLGIQLQQVSLTVTGVPVFQYILRQD